MKIEVSHSCLRLHQPQFLLRRQSA